MMKIKCGHAMSFGRTVRMHVAVAETALGKRLPSGACVHHVNEDQRDNRNCNLVICQDNSYHKLIHYRMAALRECGNVNWIRCGYCGTYGDPEYASFYKINSRKGWHRECSRRAAMGRYYKNHEENKEKQRLYRTTNRDRINAKQRENRTTNKDIMNAKQREYRQKRKDTQNGNQM